MGVIDWWPPLTTRKNRFERFYTVHYKRVFAYALRRTRNSEWARDVVAGTFALAWQRFEQLDRKNSLPWLFGVAYRIICNDRRSKHREQKALFRLNSLATPAYEFDFERAVHAKQDWHKVTTALGLLPPTDQEVLLLLTWEGLNPRDIAVVLGISPMATRTRIHRARRLLKNVLEQAEVPCNDFLRSDIYKT